MRNNDMSFLNACRRTARRIFGIARLRPEQEAAMLGVLRGRDALVALPTGFGKSLIYQVPAMILERPTIVISPLVALMADQERALRSRGVLSSCFTADCAPPSVAPHLKGSKAADASSSLPHLRRSNHPPPHPTSSVLDRRSSASTKRTASRSGGTTFDRPTCGLAAPARGWATRRRSHLRQRRRPVFAATSQ